MAKVEKSRQQPLRYQREDKTPLETEIRRVLCPCCDSDVRNRDYIVYSWHNPCHATPERIAQVMSLIDKEKEK